MKVRLERRYRFSASHLYRRPEWSEEENRARFGKCANLPGHGHNYRLFVTVRGEVDPETGFVVDLGALDSWVQATVLEPLDHQHLNFALPEFGEGGKIPSSENLLAWIRRELLASMKEGGSGAQLVKLRLEEDEDLAAEWLAGE
ncbi:MAG: 6-pyruvoyltetrahydropterin/6-carboxytetrahydropterin synthase [Acidobacteriota bacterium]|jgi:6-pyruvoyltetrahydropterin/6-carboxytetrahydropterin synthase|nr:6-pyruvoyltetrahydropterin/6-carboxytetrahydropterin synthase [Acidobacteriota bacterium]